MRKMFRILPETWKDKFDTNKLLHNKRIRITIPCETFEQKEFENSEEFVKEVKGISFTEPTIFGFSEHTYEIYSERQMIVSPETFSGDDDGYWFEIEAEFEYFE
jgi:hypothetical protein